MHHELPDLMIPYKRYAADVIEETIYPADGGSR
ncbi:DUF6431 domain-containing protein [Metabacillus lacus]